MTFTRVDTAIDMARALEGQSWDAVISDVSMPSFSAQAALDLYHRFDCDCPFIVVSGVISEELAVGLLKAGAHDFVLKSNPVRLVPALERERREAVSRRARRAAEAALEANRQRYAAELKAANEQLRQAVAAKVRFLAAASHDLRQPLQAMVCFSSVLVETLSGQPGVEVARHLDTAIGDLKGLLDGMVDVSKLDAGLVRAAPEDFALAPLLDRLAVEYGLAAERKGLRLRSRAGGRLIARSDPILLRRILRNLIDNALCYTERGGILLCCRRRQGRARIEVWDTGIGIAADQHPHLFEEFYQVGNPERDRAKGLGLGLSIVELLTRLLGHQIEFRSIPGRGSMFAVTLPLGTGPVAAPAGGRPALERAPSAASVLVIEDNALVAASFAQLISGWGCRTLTAASAEAAVAQLAETGIVPAAIIADWSLGDGESGLDAVRHVRHWAAAAIPAVIVSGDSLAVTDTDGLPVLTKPVRGDDLLRALAAAIGSAPGGGGNAGRMPVACDAASLPD